jgi:hypothetical protein
MKKKSTSQSGFFGQRALIGLLLCVAAACSILTGTLLAYFRPDVPAKASNRALTFGERVAYQRAIEEVYWRHRIWPNQHSEPKPSLDAVMPQAQLEKKVSHYLRNSQALEGHWQRRLSAEQLQAEMDRMAQHTKQPEVLRELFEALGNDPFVIAECLAQPAVAERAVTNLYAYDQRIHGELRRRAESELQMHPTVEQMKQLSGRYTEVELVRSDSGQAQDDRSAEPSVKLNSREWDENVQKLAAMFGGTQNGSARTGMLTRVAAGVSPAEGAPTSQIKTGVLSSLQEDDVRYYATAVLRKSKNRFKVGTVAWLKEPFESWAATAEMGQPERADELAPHYTLPTVKGSSTENPSTSCTANSWTQIGFWFPLGVRVQHTAVWTGSEMIVWGGWDFWGAGFRYNPATDFYLATSPTNAPTGRYSHTAVWTGTEMIIWGGYPHNNTGGRYNPVTDSWVATTTTNAPGGREHHTAVWTGSEMIIWGGAYWDYAGWHHFNSGGRYNPSTNSWVPTTIANAPIRRAFHTAVWTGHQMVVWGGFFQDANTNSHPLNTGGTYNPIANGWTATNTTNAPSARALHTAVWTGSDMIVWGGRDQNITQVNTGGRYNPSANGWTATSTVNAPSAREDHTAVWTGREMIIWGGNGVGSGHTNTGGRYNPGTGGWVATTLTNAPVGQHRAGRSLHTAVWTGNEMIVWGGSDGNARLSNGGRYCALPAASPYDLNHDSKPDYVLYKASTRQTAVWYMHNNVHAGGASTGTLPAGWTLVGAADFNFDGNNDYVLFNSSTRHTAIWYLSGVRFIRGAPGPTLPAGWALIETGDFNRDRKPDYVLYNASTRQTVVWYLNNNVYVGGAYGPTIPAPWSLAGVADFNRDGKSDYLLFNPSTRSSVIWYLSGTARIGSAFGPAIAAGYNLAGAADFNGDGKPDYLLFNPSTRQTAIWYLNNNVRIGTAVGPTLTAGWTLAAP